MKPRSENRTMGRSGGDRSQQQSSKQEKKSTSILQKSNVKDNMHTSEQIIPDMIAPQPNEKVEVISIGGLGEIGKNTWAFRYKDQILVVDAGLGFPNESMHGVDLVLPDLTFLIENKDKIVGMIVTHGHEDHIGGIPNLLRAVNIPIIYAPPLAVGLIENKLKDRGIKGAVLKRYEPRETIKLGEFAATMLRNNHSIPDSFAFTLQTPAGFIVHTGDFKFDHTPADGELTDVLALAEASKRGVDLMISDSTNAERPGFSPSEQSVGPNIEKAFIRATKRILITTFSSQVHRIGQILELAQKYGRKVAILGRSMLNIAMVSRQLGYMSYPDGLLIRADEISRYPLNKICILSTGSQGETLSALTRISNGSHRQISIIPGDTVVVSAAAIPGNERSVASMVNALCSRGANVIYGRDAGVHVSGHGSQDEQKLMFNLIKPKSFMPAHGEYRMLVAHGETAKKVLGIPDENVHVMQNGDVLELSTDAQCNVTTKVTGHIPIGIMMVDSNNHSHAIPAEIIDDRYNMSIQGLLSMVLTIDSGEIVMQPELIFRGLAFNDKEEESALREELLNTVNQEWSSLEPDNNEKLEKNLQERITQICKEHKQKPIIQVMLLNAVPA